MITVLGFFANIFLLGITGTTLGKWIYGIRVAKQDGSSLGIGLAFKRELAVFVRGYGFGIPLVSLFTLVTGYRTLTSEKMASWDRDYALQVSQRANSVGQLIAGAAAILALVVGLIALNAIK